MSEKGKIIKNTNQWLDIRKTLSKCSERDLLGLIADKTSHDAEVQKRIIDEVMNG